VDGTREHHFEQNKPSLKKPNITYFHSYVESKCKILIVIMKIGREDKRRMTRVVESVGRGGKEI
jgi:hypothetical protein